MKGDSFLYFYLMVSVSVCFVLRLAYGFTLWLAALNGFMWPMLFVLHLSEVIAG